MSIIRYMIVIGVSWVLLLGMAAAPAMAESDTELVLTPREPAAETEVDSEWPPGLVMEGLGAVGVGEPLEYLGIQIWGFTQAGFMGRLTGGQDPLPLRVFDARRPNNFRFHQLRLTLERPYDTDKAVDIGGRIDGLFGGDAMLTRGAGLFEGAGHGNGEAYADMLQGYGQAWIKTGEESGFVFTVGRFVTTLGYEVIDAPGNALYSRSYLFGLAIPFTHTGVKVDYVWNSQVSTYFAIVKGWEVWRDNNDAHSYMAGGAISSVDGRTNLYLNVITGPEQDDNVNNFRTVVDGTLEHQWTDRLTQALNADWGTEQNVPDVGSAHWYGLAHYLTYVFNDYVSGTWRAEWFRDDRGSRTGVDGSFFENTLGVTLTPWPNDKILKNLYFRPELRWDFSDRPAFGGGRQNQLTAGMDVIFTF